MNSSTQTNTPKIIFGTVVAFLTWFSIVFQFYLTTGSIANLFSYFTILCNLLVALSLSFSIFLPKTKTGIYFSSISVQTAIALYIFIVALVYNSVLRGLLLLEGWQILVDNMLHVVIPILYLLYWFFFVPKAYLNWKNGMYWTLFPFLYLIYSLIRGAIVQWYPYPFLNAAKYGYEQVIFNIGIMLLVFFSAGAILIVVNNKVIRK
jgi:hypothetical protein